jgi:hypothetical protein
MKEVYENERNKADEQDEKSGQLVFIYGEGGSKQLRGATVEKLIERVIDPATNDFQFVNSLLLTYRCYMDINKLLDLLVKRTKDSPGTNGPSPIQLRVCRMMKRWIDSYPFDFQDDNINQKSTELLEFIRKQGDKEAEKVKFLLDKKVDILITYNLRSII